MKFDIIKTMYPLDGIFMDIGRKRESRLRTAGMLCVT